MVSVSAAIANYLFLISCLHRTKGILSYSQSVSRPNQSLLPTFLEGLVDRVVAALMQPVFQLASSTRTAAYPMQRNTPHAVGIVSGSVTLHRSVNTFHFAL